MNVIIKRLELIKNCIALQEHQLVSVQAELLKDTDNQGLSNILELIECSFYSDASKAIDEFIKSHTGLVIFEDPEIQTLKSEINLLGSRISVLTADKEEMVGLIEDFNREYHIQVGGIMAEILLFKRRIYRKKYEAERQAYEESHQSFNRKRSKLQELQNELTELNTRLDGCELFSEEYDEISDRIFDVEEEIKQLRGEIREEYENLKSKKEDIEGGSEKDYKEASEDHESFSEEHEEEIKKDVNNLSPEEQRELKALYRKASKLCHPDRVGEEQKEKATELMTEVNRAYKAKDLKGLRELVSMLEGGMHWSSASDSSNEKEWLQNKAQELRQKAKDLEDEIVSIRESELWQDIIEIDDWMDYFRDTKETLAEILEDTKEEYEQA
ncbi:J domain-containing protein [Vibrio owensii]|uniref:J domain-containing protein n=1 Tax=Vibrio owensii TaxID=696485 RepID=UPI003AB07C04